MKRSATIVLALVLAAGACSGGGGPGPLTLYSGRSEELIQPLIDDFTAATGIEVEVRYGNSSELAATLLEEGTNSPADVFLAQDPASIGVVANDGILLRLGDALVQPVPERFRDPDNLWVGLSGRVRVVVYDATKVDPSTLPENEDGFADDVWAGRVAVAPTNGSFLSFVAAKILLDGEDATRIWLERMAANDQPTYARNSVIVEAVDGGEVDIGLVNHYYLFRRIAEVGEVNAANHFLSSGAGSLVMPAGAGIVATTDQRGGRRGADLVSPRHRRPALLCRRDLRVSPGCGGCSERRTATPRHVGFAQTSTCLLLRSCSIGPPSWSPKPASE